MDRITVTFLTLLALATFASGQLWIRGKLWIAGSMTALDGAMVLVSAVLLGATFLGMGRMLHRTAQVPAVVAQEDGEDAWNPEDPR